MIRPCVFYHDQEPLNFDYYRNQNCIVINTSSPPQFDFDFEEVIQFKKIYPTLKYNCYDYAIICHSEKNSKNLKFYEDHEYIGVYWWSHAAIARDWYRCAEHDLDLIANFKNIKYDFLIYNRAWGGTREYRLKFAEIIADQQLVKYCRTSFSATDVNGHYTNHVFVNSNLEIKKTDLETCYPANTSQSTASADYNAHDYTECGIEVVLETLFDDDRVHLTEKSLRPIACGRPFVIASSPGSLEYLRNYGFETFSGLIDESYDLVQNPLERLQAIAKEMQRIAELNIETKLQLWQKLYKIAERNKKLFFSNTWQNKIFQEYQDNFNAAMKFMKQHRTGKRWKQVLSAGEKNPDLKQHIYYPRSGIRSAADVEFVNAWLANTPD